MAIYSGNFYLSTSQMKANAQYILDYLAQKGWSKNAVCGMLGNLQRESTINPGIWQNLDEGNTSLGIGLVQWTPASKLINWATDLGLNYLEMDTQLKRILWELENGEQYYQTDTYPMSFSEFTKSTKSSDYLASVFLYNYERAGVAAEDERRDNAMYWYINLTVTSEETTNFTPRLDLAGINGAYYWYDGSPFYIAGYGMPNCTTYAWGRFWEISDLSDGTQDYSNKPRLSTSDAGNWYSYTQDGYERGSTPKLGSVICWEDTTGGSGHVGIVEKIEENGDIVVSQSGWNSTYFWTNTKLKADGYSYSKYKFQGFIYNPNIKVEQSGEDNPNVDIGYPTTRGKFKWVLTSRKRREMQCLRKMK